MSKHPINDLGVMLVRATRMQAERFVVLFEIARRLGIEDVDALAEASELWISLKAEELSKAERRRWGLHEQNPQ